MNRRDEEKVICGVLADTGLETLRQETLQRGLEAVRSKARRRGFARGTALASLVAVVALLIVWERFPPDASEERTMSAAPPPAVQSPPSDPIERIDDRELLALFPNKTVALIGPPTRQFLVFSDQPQVR
jgi:hypothetical protein